jgi:carbamoyl-phosphate synthase small subunit
MATALPSAPALLALENGTTFRGYAFGDLIAESEGEVIFNTAMAGYQEALTDPSYYGQILTFTYPHIGNYGVNAHDGEATTFQAAGLIAREYSPTYSNWRASMSLAEFMQRDNKIGIEGLDTRALVRLLRSEGVMRGIISAKEPNADVLIDRARAIPSMDGLDLTGRVTTPVAYLWQETTEPYILSANGYRSPKKLRVAALDFGIKRNILRRLASYGCEVMVFPSNTSAQEIREYKPDGVFLSNGPGDPAAVTYAIETIHELVQEFPVFGICLGHQLLGLAFGAATAKMKFGHRGVNHPVKNLITGGIEITSQNHGFAVERDSMPPELELTHINLNDNTVSGFRHRTLPVFCVQYHPEASPGTHDSDYLFGQFVASMMERKNVAVAA